MAASTPNPLLSASASDTSLSVQLHPLVLLTISNYITRHRLRDQDGPIVGAIIGQQHGREVTMEHAFQCKLKGDGERIIMDDEWFTDRLEQMKDVHKAPALDLVAIFTLGPPTGPLPEHIPIIQQLQHQYNDSLILLLFHPETILDGSLTGGKLPISLYESYYEPGSEGADKGLQVDGWGLGRQLLMRFRELSYEMETGEAEMIGIDFVAKGGGNATAIAGNEVTGSAGAKGSKKGKGKAGDSTPTNGAADEGYLSAEDEDLIASITAKANAIRMLHQRISLIKAYLSALPPSYLTDASHATSTIQPGTESLNHPLLRNISSLLTRLPLLAPPSTTPFTTSGAATPTSKTASAREHSDVQLVSLLSSLTRSIAEAKDLGAKYHVLEKAKRERGGMNAGGRAGRFGGFDSGNTDSPMSG